MGLGNFPFVPHGLLRGLHSLAAARLDNSEFFQRGIKSEVAPGLMEGNRIDARLASVQLPL